MDVLNINDDDDDDDGYKGFQPPNNSFFHGLTPLIFIDIPCINTTSLPTSVLPIVQLVPQDIRYTDKCPWLANCWISFGISVSY